MQSQRPSGHAAVLETRCRLCELRPVPVHRGLAGCQEAAGCRLGFQEFRLGCHRVAAQPH